MKKIISEIRKERKRQDLKWGIQNHNPFYWMGILGEETGEVCKAVIEKYPATVFEKVDYLPDLRKEIIQVAAVCIAWLECMERNSE